MIQVSRTMIIFLISVWLIMLNSLTVYCASHRSIVFHSPVFSQSNGAGRPASDSSGLGKLNNSLKDHLIRKDYESGKKIAEEIVERILSSDQNSSIIADSYYYLGVYYQLVNDYKSSIEYLDKSISLKEKLHHYDNIYANALYNQGGNYSRLGDFKKHKEYTLQSLGVEKRIYGDESPHLIITYGSIITAYIELKEYGKALDFAEVAYKIADKDPVSVDPFYIAFLYQNIGVLYNSISDYSKSRIFFEKAEEYYNLSGKTSDEGYMSLMHNMANALRNLDLKEISDKYNEKAFELAKDGNSLISYLILRTYAGNLGKAGRLREGESLMSELLMRVQKKSGANSKDYHEVMAYFADYLRQFKIDDARAFAYCEKCIEYFDRQEDSFLKFNVKEGYARILSSKGEYEKSLHVLQTLLFPEGTEPAGEFLFLNPDIGSINADKDFLGVLRTKYSILKEYYDNEPDLKILEARANTAESIISLLEKTRINISVEESRLLLGDRYRDSYLDVIKDFYLLFNLTSEKSYLDKVFEYSEKSKIAGLLTSTRELKATQFHIPADLAELERNLQQETAVLNDRIAGKSSYGNESDEIVSLWKSKLFNTIRKRDSLINVFEDQYPDYYSIKYNTQVIKPGEIPHLVGRKASYISYVASDTVIYINVINRKHQKVIAISVDSSFYSRLEKFRTLLSVPRFDDAREEFRVYNTIGYELYNTLITPVKPYLISDRVVISPDNLLSYLPFETLPVSDIDTEDLYYSRIDYLMEELDISYTYSATFLDENRKRDYQAESTAIAFAPDYSEPVDIQSLFQRRQQTGNTLADIPFAKKEAEYVSELLGGKLLMNEFARESAYKSEAGNYKIIHLAMHTVLDDTDPMYSTLIFSPEKTGEEDRFLRTFEIYGVPLKSRMVVLSSCNTGSGKLYSGEGILSLARGFIYSGSESVVMSMWEIEDRTGTEIVKSYYDNLKKGYSKSMSLRKARMKFLKTADQLRAHPYFWSTLVIYGDNSALFRPVWILPLTISLILLIFSLTFYYLRKRMYS
jgi:CHAT domain-containing protein/tetratricopeptide (TPR) repeat protein